MKKETDVLFGGTSDHGNYRDTTYVRGGSIGFDGVIVTAIEIAD